MASRPNKMSSVENAAGTTMPNVESLPESHLGTKEHWDQVYEYVVDLLTGDVK